MKAKSSHSKFRLADVAPRFSAEAFAKWTRDAAPVLVNRLWPILHWRFPAAVPAPPRSVLYGPVPDVERPVLRDALVGLGFKFQWADLLTAQSKTEQAGLWKTNRGGHHCGLARDTAGRGDAAGAGALYRVHLPVVKTWQHEDGRRDLL